MTRTAASAGWYLPLVAGTEVAARSGGLAQHPVGDLVGQLPGPKPWALPGLVLWLDARSTSTVKLDNLSRVYRWEDRSGNSNDATQTTAQLRPRINNSISPLAVDFKE